MTAGKAQTPHQSDDDEQQDIRDEMQSHEPEDSGSHPQHTQIQDNDRPQVGRQKAVAAVSNVNPPEMIAKLTCALKKSNLRVIQDVGRLIAAMMPCLMKKNKTEFRLTNYGSPLV